MLRLIISPYTKAKVGPNGISILNQLISLAYLKLDNEMNPEGEGF